MYIYSTTTCHQLNHYMKNILLPCVFATLLCSSTIAYAQKLPEPHTYSSPNGTFDKVYDRFGKQYDLNDIRILEKPSGSQSKLNGPVAQPNSTAYSQILCTSTGYFNVYFENGSGFEQNTSTQIARRDVICQLFNDLSNHIVPANPSVKVNIWVRDISNIISNPSSSGVLGLATSFYSMPALSTASSGIVDGEVWETINSGTDGYKNTVTPLVSQGSQYSSPGGAYYHGMMAFNFANTSINWHTNLTTATASGLYDLYSVALHEMTHALGFASLIDYNGVSKFGSTTNYYSRYDLFLKTQGNQNLITNTGSCNLYNFQFNPGLNANTTLSPNPATCGNTIPYNGSLDNTTCATAIKFTGSVNQSVYTPDCFEPPSSLSHLEDQCHAPAPYGNNLYYCMSNANGTGSAYMKRYLKPEERIVLCDIGYKVNTTYGNTLYAANNYNYGGSQCPGQSVAGVNDGITTLGTYSWTALTSGIVNIPGSGLLSNDFSANQFECLGVMNGMGSVNISSGTSSSTITFTAGTNTGVALLRYVPVNTTTGKRGNITYAYVYINSANCVASPCNMVLNGGFENGLNCGQYYQTDNPDIYCWTPLHMSPDYMVRNCTPPSGFGGIPTPTTYCNPPADTWNGPGTNDKFLGMGFYNNTPGSGMEAIQTMLASPIQPNVPYVISFWARTFHGTIFAAGTANVMFRGATGTLAPLPWSVPYNTVGQQYTDVDVPDDGQWHYYTLPFTNTGTQPLQNLLIGVSGYTSPNYAAYVGLDDIVLTPANNTATFQLPDSLCDNASIADLSQYVFPAFTSGGSFSGTGVVYTGGLYTYTPSTTGLQTITYNYVNSSGCSLSIQEQIYIKSCPPPPGGSHHVMTYEGHDDMKHYTTQIVPGSNDESVMAGTIFHSTSGGTNTIHFMRLDNQGNILVSEEYISGYKDERAVDIEGLVQNGKQFWYIVCLSRRAGGNDQDMIKVLCLDNNGNLVDQREYEDIAGGQYHLYPMHSTVWTDQQNNDNRLYICGYTTFGSPTTFPQMPDYLSRKHAFILSIGLNMGSNHLLRLNSMAYDWSWNGPYDYDIAMRTRVVEQTNQIFVTGSVNGIIPQSQAHQRSATMNLVVDPNTLNVVSDFPFIKNEGSDDLSGPHEYGVDLIQINGKNFILGNTTSTTATNWNNTSEIDMYPRWHKIFFIQPLNAGAPFSVQSQRNTFGNIWGHWAAHAIRTSGTKVTLATLIRDQYSTCIPLPYTPGYDNVNVDLITADLGTWPYGSVASGPNIIYRTSTGTGDPSAVSNSFYELGGSLSLMDVSPTFAALGINQYVINAPKYMNNQFLNIKYMNPDLGFNTICGGDFDANQQPCTNGGTYFIIEDAMKVGTKVQIVNLKLDKTPYPMASKSQPYAINNPTPCIDLAGNGSYKEEELGMQELTRGKTSVYPNPATDRVTVELSEDVSKNAMLTIKVRNIYGQEIGGLFNVKRQPRIDVSLPNIVPGMYFIEIYADQKLIHHEKLTIQQ